jgi:Na+(H+)/acetate symporter ActP
MGGTSITLAALLYPAYQAVVLRWWSSGLRFGDIEIRSRLRMRQVYGAYARFVGYAILFSIVMGIGGAIALVLVGGVAQVGKGIGGEVATTLVGLVGYVITVLGFSTIYRATVLLSLWQMGMESLQLSGLSALEKVKASGRPSSALGEGLADALNVGSY